MHIINKLNPIITPASCRDQKLEKFITMSNSLEGPGFPVGENYKCSKVKHNTEERYKEMEG